MIKPTKLILSLATAVCAFATCATRAQTNPVTFSVTMTLQGPSTTVQGTNTSYAAAKATPFSSAALIAELGLVTHNSFSKTAKLEIVTTGNGPEFGVGDGADLVLISTNIMSLNPVDSTSVISGVLNGGTGLSFPTTKALTILELDYNDIGLGGKDIAFSMRGLFSGTSTDTVPSPTTGDYTETSSAKISSMTGDGTEGGTNFVATGSLSASGKASLSLQ